MSFSLRIHFSGLCLFTAEEERLHTILVDHSGRSHHGESEVHLSRLVYDRAYEERGADRLSGHIACEKLDGCVLRLDDLVRGIGFPLPEQIVNLDTIAKVGELSREYVADAPQPKGVNARVTINAGECTHLTRGAQWRVDEGPTQGWRGEITTCVQWTIKANEAEALSGWKRIGFDGTEKPLKTLHPIGRAIDLFVYNVTRRDLPPPEQKNNPGLEAEHFEAYYQFFDTPPIIPRAEAPHEVVPCLPNLFRRSDCKPEWQGTQEEIERIMTPIVFNCVVAQAPLAQGVAGKP